MSRKAAKLNQKKVDVVASLKDKLGKAKALFVTEYRGLTHQQLEKLRKSLKKVEAEYVVAKNRLLKIAMHELKNATCLPARQEMRELEGALENPTATLFAFGDEIAAIKTLSDFIKTAQLPTVKIGIFSGSLATEADFKKLAALPSREILLATLASRLQGPVTGLHYALRYNLQRLAVAVEGVKNKKA